MATQSDYLKLTLAGNNEYQDTWDQVLNANFKLLDAWSMAFGQEVQEARNGMPALKDFLAVGHNEDGSIRPIDEVISARTSVSYGDEDEAGKNFSLSDRLNRGDKEVLDAREGYPSLRDALAARALSVNKIIKAPQNSNSYPAWLGFTGQNVQVDGSVAPIWMEINGFLCRIRTLSQITLSGAFGTKHLYAKFERSGLIRVDGDASVAPPAIASGTIGSDGTKVRILQDLLVDFTAADVQPGDILTILGNSDNARQYIIKQVAPGGNHNQIQIVGNFPGGAAAGVNYTIADPMAVTLGFDPIQVETEGKLYIGEADYDGLSAVIATRPLQTGDTFIGEWRAVNVLDAPGTFEQTWNHNLFDDAVTVNVQVSQTNDGLSSVEELDVATLTSDLAVVTANGLAFSAGTFDPGTPGTGGTAPALNPPPSLTGTVTSSLTGSVYPDRSIRLKWNKTQTSIKNVIAGKFYRDYTGAEKSSGYVRVIVKKRRA